MREIILGPRVLPADRTSSEALASHDRQFTMMSRGDRLAREIACEGWWDQAILGRQPMRELRLRFEDGQITGGGHDIIGLFTLRGSIAPDGHVTMIKRYLGQHSVNYVGQYDGEGSFHGQWHIGPDHNRWFIKIARTTADPTERTLEAETIV